MGGPKLQFTKDYDLFELHQFNRNLHKDRVLEESMKKYGFMPSSPLHCVKDGNGKLRIIRGHHRFDRAKRLGIGVWYVIDETNTEIFDLEAVKSQWSIMDFAQARAKAGDEDCIKLLEFMEKHKINIGGAASLLGGQSAGSGNKRKQIKNGSFHLGDIKHANQVTRIIDRARELNIPFATNSSFVAGISSALRVKEFDINLFLHKLELNGSQMRKRGTSMEYLEEIEALYNYSSSKSRLPLAFLAKEIGKKRQKHFGATK